LRRDALDRLLDAARRGERTLIVGILNVTPDSFSDGGRFAVTEDAVAEGCRLWDEGADIIDVGGESTRPGASVVPVSEELRRVVPVVEALAKRCPAPISVDTRKARVAEAAIAAGADLVNDVSAMTADPDMLGVVAGSGSAVCLMHMQGAPDTMQDNPTYSDVVREVRSYLSERAEAAISAGVCPSRIVLDPGFGFGKTLEHNLELLRRLSEIADLGFPVMAGTSRKSMLGRILDGKPPSDRIEGTAATVAIAIAKGASLVRVHDVRIMARVARVADAVSRPGWRPQPSDLR